MVADASALRLVPDAIKQRSAQTLITPHDREFEAFAGRPVGDERAAAAMELAVECKVTVLLKGHVTIIAEPSRRVLVNIARGSWAATAGSGDVLSGMIGALLATGSPGSGSVHPAGSGHVIVRAPVTADYAAPIAAHIHSRAADLAAGGEKGAPITASRLAAHIPEAIRAVRGILR